MNCCLEQCYTVETVAQCHAIVSSSLLTTLNILTPPLSFCLLSLFFPLLPLLRGLHFDRKCSLNIHVSFQ